MIQVLSFLLIFTIFTTIRTMEEHPKTWLKTSDKKIFSITYEEACHSLYINFQNESHNEITGFNKQTPTKINIKKKDIRFFQNILHRPAFYDILPEKNYFKALNIATKLQAPLLYADLLTARLPKAINKIIAEKYMLLHNMPISLAIRIYKQFHRPRLMALSPQSYDKIKNLYLLYTPHAIETLVTTYNDFITATLPQAVILSLITYQRKYYFCDTTMSIIPHMPGYKAFTQDWTTQQQEFLINNSTIKSTIKKTKTTGTKVITSITFNV